MREKLLCECQTGVHPGERTDEEWHRFREASYRAGYPSAVAAANLLGLWGTPVLRAIAVVERQAEEKT